MTVDLCISVRFLHPYPLYHGRTDGGQPEWPPSPMRLFQALLNAASLRSRGGPLSADVRAALEYLEAIRPRIVAPPAAVSAVGYRAYVPHNQADLVSAAWHRGRVEASIASHRMEKDYRAVRIERAGDELPALHFLYPLGETVSDPESMLRAVRPAARAVTHLGWGIDQVAGDAMLVDSSSETLSGERWMPSPHGGRRLRLHRRGSLDALCRRYERFLSRIQGNEWTPVPPLAAFDHVRYRRDADPESRPWCAFRLVDSKDEPYAYPHAKLIHLSGMTRHLAIDAMTRRPPRDVSDPARWVEQYVAGHREKTAAGSAPHHSQFSYVPLPSVGHAHTDPGVRRVMIVAPPGHDDSLEHLARQLDGRQLEPEHAGQLRGPVFLSRIRHDGVIECYTKPSRSWASFTPVILPGHDDRKPAKTQKLIRKALSQSGIDQPCEFEWSVVSHFARSYSAHAHLRGSHSRHDRRPAGYIRPDHLLNLPAVHLRLTFEQPVPGPLTIGAGRHCGFGLMVVLDE